MWASGSTWFGKGSQGSAGPEFLCLGDYLSPPRQVWGFAPRGMRSADAPPPTPAAGAPPAGPWQEPDLPRSSLTMCDLLWKRAQLAADSPTGHRPRCKREAFAESHVGRLTVRVRKRRSEECLFVSGGP
jgi:hypothetical protein